jgi:hypothetical protein
VKISDCFFVVGEVEIVAGRVSQDRRWSGYLGLKTPSQQKAETGTPRPYVLREAHRGILSGCFGPRVRLYGTIGVKPIKQHIQAGRTSNTKLLRIARAAERCTGINLPAKQPLRIWREHQISDISHFWVNDVTLKKVMKIANRKFHDLFQFCRRIHGRIIVLPINERCHQK